RIITRHIIPNVLAPVIVLGTLNSATYILEAAALGFLGLGAKPGSAEWGAMLSQSRASLMQGDWWITFFPGLFIFILVLGLNLLGDGLRDALDPELSTEEEVR
ncbi:MAG: ABC transporter permease subunit, partial [Halobacteriaceae archaeon]